MNGALRLLSLATTLCVAGAAFGEDREVRNAARHFRFERPEAWTPIDGEFLDGLRAEFSKLSKAFEPLEVGFELIGSFGVPPVADGGRPLFFAVIVQRWSSAPRTYAGLKRRFSNDFSGVVAEQLGLPRGRIDGLEFDRERGRVMGRGETTRDEAGDVESRMVGLVGKEGVVWFVGHARPADVTAARALIDGVADSFRWDDGFEYREAPTTGVVVGPTEWRDVSGRWSTDLPRGWTGRPPSPGDSKWLVAWFAPKDAEQWIDPTVMVGWAPVDVGRASWAEFESACLGDRMQQLFAASPFGFGAVKAKVDCGRTVFDKLTGRSTTEFAVEFAGLRWKGIWVMYFGRDGAAQFVLHAMESDFDAAKPAFDEIVESFRLDDGFGWKDAFPLESIDWAAVGRNAAAVTGLGVLCVAIVRIVRARRAKRDGAAARERLLRSGFERHGR
jgi:hypothetical protein